ncbi:MAG: hypothetical protein ACYC61_17860 [Isosphaeraceae bacterium]
MKGTTSIPEKASITARCSRSPLNSATARSWTCCSIAHLDVVQLSIDRGADLHAVGSDGLTPLAWAIREGRDEVAGMLRNAGAVN